MAQQLNREDVRQMYEYQTFSPNKAIFSVAALGIFGYFGYKYLTNMAAEKDKQKAADAVQDNNNAQIALALKGAIFNIGVSWAWATFDEVKAFALADRITSLKEVRKYYQIYHNRNLDDDLQKQASAEELVEFMRRANKSKTQAEVEAATTQSASPDTDFSQTANEAPSPDYSGSYRQNWIGKLAMLSSPANIRTEPKKANNILVPMKDVLANNLLGLLTGKISDNGYVEIFVRFDTDKDASYGSQYAYRNVIKPLSAFNVFSTDYQKLIKNTGILVYVHKDYIKDASSFSKKGSQYGYSDDTKEIGISLKGVGFPQKIYIKKGHQASIFDRRMKKRGMADERHCLGDLISTLNTPKGDIYEFQNLQGKTRWVHAKHTIIQ